MIKAEHYAKLIARKYARNSDERDDIEAVCLEFAIGKNYSDGLLFVAMRRITQNYLRTERRRERKFCGDRVISENDVISYINTSIKLELLKSKLNEEENNILDLLTYGYGCKEIGIKLSIPLSTSIWKIRNLKLRVKKLWKDI